MRNNADLAELFRTTDPARLMVIKSLLDSAEIPYTVQGEDSLRLNPFGISGGFLNPSALCAIVWIRREDLEDARVLIEEPNLAPGDRE